VYGVGRARTSLLAIATICFWLLLGSPPTAASTPCFSDDFESGIAGWYANGATLAQAAKGHNADSHHSLMVSTGTYAFVESERIAVRPDSSYELTELLSKDAGSYALVTVLVSWTNSCGKALPVDEQHQEIQLYDNQWSTVSVSALAPSDAAYAYIELSTDIGTYYLDDVIFDGPIPDSPAVCPTATATATETPTHAPSPSPAPSSTLAPVATVTPAAIPTEGVRDSLVNGGFEEADGETLEGWEKWGGELWQTSERFRSDGHSGAFVSNSASTKWAYQTMKVSEGTGYEFSLYVLLDDPAVSEVFLRVSWYESEDGNGSALGFSDSPVHLTGNESAFRYLTTEAVQAPVNARSGKFRVMLVPSSAAEGTIYLDDASIEQVAYVLTSVPPEAEAAEDGTGGSSQAVASAARPSPGSGTRKSEVAGAASERHAEAADADPAPQKDVERSGRVLPWVLLSLCVAVAGLAAGMAAGKNWGRISSLLRLRR
jgi:hypothetical protein